MYNASLVLRNAQYALGFLRCTIPISTAFLDRYTAGFKDDVREHLNSLQNVHPVAFCKSLESEKALQSELSILGVFHPNAGVHVRCYGYTPRDLSCVFRIPATLDSFAQLRGDWDKIEDGVSAENFDAGDGHGIQGTETTLFTFFVVELKDRYNLRNDPGLCIDEFLVLNEHQEDEASMMHEAHLRSSNTIVAANSERNGVIPSYNDAMLLEAQKLQCTNGEPIDETFLAGFDSVTKVAEVRGGVIGKGRIGATEGRVENGKINVIE